MCSGGACRKKRHWEVELQFGTRAAAVHLLQKAALKFYSLLLKLAKNINL